MRIASYNVESLFERARALDPRDWEAGRQVLEQHARINRLLGEPEYTDAVKAEIKALLEALGLEKRDDGRTYARLRRTADASLSAQRVAASRSSPRAATTGSAGWSSRPSP